MLPGHRGHAPSDLKHGQGSPERAQGLSKATRPPGCGGDGRKWCRVRAAQDHSPLVPRRPVGAQKPEQSPEASTGSFEQRGSLPVPKITLEEYVWFFITKKKRQRLSFVNGKSNMHTHKKNRDRAPPRKRCCCWSLGWSRNRVCMCKHT